MLPRELDPADVSRVRPVSPRLAADVDFGRVGTIPGFLA